ncbi:formin-like protein 3 [Abrus precatorius]|uniref:Formin-like protein n=1 Tax=Abrus precatorius TaxID=3816 RepID=A0A8B8KW89_ABRPR|nr:formin-like protein 3 [Abrus precatorius]
MELTRPSYAVAYVILLCALAQGGSEGKRGKEEEIFRDGGALSSSIYVHGIQVENAWKHCRKELIERNNDVKDFDFHSLEGSSDMRSILSIQNSIYQATKSLPPVMKNKFLDCIKTGTTPSAPVSKEKGSSRYLLTKHSRSTLGVQSGHGRNLIADSPSPSATPSHNPTSPTPSPQARDIPLPPDMFVPFPPPSRVPRPRPHPPQNFRPIIYAPISSPPSNDAKKQHKVLIGCIISAVIILIGLALCYREVRKTKVDKDDRPLLVLTSSDYSGGSQKIVRLGDDDKEESCIDNEKKLSNVTNLSTKDGDNNASQVETKPSEGTGQVPAPPSGKPAPSPPSGKSAPPPPGPPPPPAAPRPPPPPRAAPPPAPPKPMGGRNQGPLRAKEGSSSQSDATKPKLKPFFWDKVSATPDQSMVWHEINAGSFVINEEMMESLFGCTNQNRNQRKKDSSLDNTVQYIKIIDPKKAQNLSILLRALNVTTDEVVDALIEGNELPAELTQTLLKMAPTAEEELKLRLFTGELSELGPAERFLKVLVDIPFAFKRLECLMFMFILQDEFSSIKDSFATLEVACDELRKSRLFLKLLEAVLKTGNRMNDGTYRGGAQAFRLDTLLKLSDVKGTDGKITLLHFVVQEIIRSEGIRAVRTERASRSISSVGTDDSDEGSEESIEHYRSLGLQVVSGLSAELEEVKKAALIDGDALTSAVSKLGYSFVKSQEFLNTDLKNIDEESEFQRCMEKFLEKAKENVTWLVEEEKRIMALVKSTADYFHGNAGKDEGLRLFSIVRDFLIILDKVCKEVKDTTMKPVKASNSKKEATSVPSSPDTRQQSPPPASDLHRRLFPAIAERRMDYSSSDDDDDDDDEFST